jgi:hypothetical protein
MNLFKSEVSTEVIDSKACGDVFLFFKKIGAAATAGMR